MSASRATRRTAIRRVRGHSFLPALLPSNAIVLDVGANHGGFTAVLAREYGARVTAVEPNPALAGDLARSGAAEVLAVAVAEGVTSARLALDANDERSTIVEDRTPDGIGVVRVDALSLAALIDAASADQVDLVKLDVEGAEVAALAGLDGMHLARVGQLTVEFHDGQGLTPPRVVRDVCRRLVRGGFSTVRMSVRHRADVLFVRTDLLTGRERWWLRWIERPNQIARRAYAQARRS